MPVYLLMEGFLVKRGWIGSVHKRIEVSCTWCAFPGSKTTLPEILFSTLQCVLAQAIPGFQVRPGPLSLNLTYLARLAVFYVL